MKFFDITYEEISNPTLISVFLHNFLDKINFKVTLTDIAYPVTQYCKSDRLHPFAETHLTFLNPDPAQLN